jgi:predicted DNA-binding transcriptional regulator AlpA
MQLDTESLKKLCRKKRIRLNDMLEEAKVSRTAYYAMTRKESVLPKSVPLSAGHVQRRQSGARVAGGNG